MKAREFVESKSLGYEISKHASKLHKLERFKKIKPGTNNWFKLWFARPFLTHEK